MRICVRGDSASIFSACKQAFLPSGTVSQASGQRLIFRTLHCRSVSNAFSHISALPAVRAEQVRRHKRLNAHADASDAVSDKRTDKFLCHIFRFISTVISAPSSTSKCEYTAPRMRQSCSDVKTDGVPPPIYTERTEPPKSALLFDSQAHKHNLRAFFERICE